MSFQTHILNPTVANKTLSLSILGILKPWNFPANLFCYPFGERDSLKRSKYTRRSRQGKNRVPLPGRIFNKMSEGGKNKRGGRSKETQVLLDHISVSL